MIILKKKIGLFAVFVGLILAVTACSNYDCHSFKNGKFKLTETENGSEYIINRVDSIQTEYELQTGIKLVFRVHWLSDCQYTLQLIKGRKETMDFFKNKLMTVDILDTYSDGYNFSMKISGSDQIRYGVMRKIE